MEPETGNVVNSATRALALFNELRSARLRIVLDPANLLSMDNIAQQRDILDAAFDLLGEHLIMAHAKDVQVVEGVHHVVAGTGLLDYPHFLSLLRDRPVPLVVHGLSEVEVPRALEFLRATSHGVGRPAQSALPARA